MPSESHPIVSRDRRVIVTHASPATVYRWATTGPRRRRAKYRNTLTLCRIIDGRYGVIMGTDAAGQFGDLAWIRVSYGWGHVRDCGPVAYWAGADVSIREGVRRALAQEPTREAREPWCENHSQKALRRMWRR